jgi:PAS domain-containing protein
MAVDIAGRGHWEGELTHTLKGRPGDRGSQPVAVKWDDTGRQVGVLGINRDITECKRAEARIRESEKRYRTLFESVDQGFCAIEVLFDDNERPADYRFLTVNPAFERQTGIQNGVGRRMRGIAPCMKSIGSQFTAVSL